MGVTAWTGTNIGSGPVIDSLAEIAHDLRQPISTIRALVGSLRATEVHPEGLRWHLDSMEAEVAHLADLVKALLGVLVDEPDAGVAAGNGAVEVNSSVAAVVRCFAVTWPGSVTTAFGEDADVAAPPEMFRRSLRNVLDNAARAAGKNGAILVSVITSRVGASIVVEDDGPGFGAIPTQHSIGLKIVDRTLSEAGGSLEITTSDTLGGARVALMFPPHSRV
ncbi:MAG: HAMP domain-containing sensor histidine kinase [Nocardioidaceae bacterium]